MYPKELKSGFQAKTYTRTFRAALFTTARSLKQLKCPPVDGQINNMCDVPTVEYYSAVQKKEAPIYAMTQTNPENIMLSEKSQTQKDTVLMTPSTWKFRRDQSKGPESS